MNEKEFIEYVESAERGEVTDLKMRSREIEDVRLLREKLKITSDPDVKEEIEKRIAEIKKKVENKKERNERKEEKKEERKENGKERKEKYEIGVTAVGLGGCGLNIVTQISKASKDFEEFYKINYYAYDLSDDVLRAKDITIITPTALDIGAGRVPFCAEFVFNEKIETKETGGEEAKNTILKSSINLFSHSFGGGTGSKTVSLLIQKLKKGGGTAYITLSVLTDRDGLEKINHLLTFHELNKIADFIILAENRRGRDIIRKENSEKMNELKFINKKMADLFDFMISARNKDARESPVDFNNYINFLRGGPEYNKGIRWLIPFVWPIIEDYESEYTPYPLFRFLKMALNEGSLVRVKSENMICKSCILIVKAPEDFINSIDTHKTKEDLAKELGLKKEFITSTFVPDKNGLKLCLLLYGTPFEMLYELMNVDDELIEFGLNSWRDGLKNYMEQLKAEISDEKKEEYEKKIKDPREDFKKEYEKLCGVHKK